jgi:hypothetical protein
MASRDPGRLDEAPERRTKASAGKRLRARAEELLGLYAWHKDPPRVARELGLTLDELQAELESLGIRRKAHRLAHASDALVPRAIAAPGVPSGPSVRRRTRKALPPPEDPREETASRAPAEEPRDAPAARGPDLPAQAARLKALLGQVGPRRKALAKRLGTPGRPLTTRVLLARFRAAGLERELGQRERDLLRALFSRHRGGDRKVAVELKVSVEELTELLRERGLSAEVEAVRERYRAELRQASWPSAQLSNLALRRRWLEDLRVYEELSRSARERAAPAWRKAKQAKNPLEALRRELGVGAAEARLLRDLFSR